MSTFPLPNCPQHTYHPRRSKSSGSDGFGHMKWVGYNRVLQVYRLDGYRGGYRRTRREKGQTTSSEGASSESSYGTESTTTGYRYPTPSVGSVVGSQSGERQSGPLNI